ncbi:MAG: hypothetical protein U1E36_02030 [Rickettsiales bacterium]
MESRTDIPPQQASVSFDQKHADDLSASRYATKKLYELGVTGAGVLLGGTAAYFLGKSGKFRSWITNKFGEEAYRGAVSLNEETQKLGKFSPLTFVGGTLGTAFSSLFLTYEHWRKEEVAKLSVKEINEDISNMKIRYRTDPELLKENERLRDMLAEEEKKTEALRKDSPQTRIDAKDTSSTKLKENTQEIAAGA